MLKTRDQLAIQDTWRLTDIYPDDAQWERDHAKARDALAQLTGRQGKLCEPKEALLALEESFTLDLSVSNLFCYARMKRDEDNNQTAYQALVDCAQSLAVDFGACISYIAPELLSAPEGYILSLIETPGFEDYRVYLKELLRQRPHTLSAAEERIIAMAGELSAAPETIFDMLSDADMKFDAIKGESGELVPVTQGGYLPLMMSADREVRKAAFASLYQTFKNHSASVPAIYAASVKADLFAAKVRGHEGALARALFLDDIPPSVYDNLIEAVRSHLPGLHRLVAINARLNGISDPAMYDLYVPPKQGFDINLPFDEAYALVCDCLGVLGEEYVAVLKQAREQRWIDPYQNEGKSAGAYAWGTYSTHPYVLLNYHENLDGLLTVAHEMGHAMHSHLSNKNQPYPTADYSLFVAEVASTVNEVLVLMELLERHTQREAQAYLLHNLLDSYRTTVFRQTMFAEFEKISHQMAEGGQALTVDSLSEAYADLNAAYYQGIDQTELIRYEWMRIPHFYRAFYVYKYATGFSAATAIAGMIRKQGAPAVERYKRFLSAGGSLSPIEALKLAGIDMGSPGPVQDSLALFEEMLARYEQVIS